MRIAVVSACDHHRRDQCFKGKMEGSDWFHLGVSYTEDIFSATSLHQVHKPLNTVYGTRTPSLVEEGC